ncbi:Alpha-(14)-fucosyltransferase [Zea mays]|uniref:Alpha-(14)-fucosyltransferase n=1 Tax=Zea mays TaxID=4577 RepID=A0A1D6MVM0_MAIZE|nr:Alpha-(14)-fucosyltransferase [Zea mays]
MFARHHIIFSNTALLDSVHLSTPSCRSPPRRAPALQHHCHPFSVMLQAFVDCTLESFGSRICDPFTSLLEAIIAWDATVGCPHIRTKLAAAGLGPGLPLLAASANGNGSAEDPPGASVTGSAMWRGATRCEDLAVCHVRVLIKGWTWIPNALVDVYTCHCGVSCVGSKFPAAVDRPGALLFEVATPPPCFYRLLRSLMVWLEADGQVDHLLYAQFCPQD